ncbi:MAG: hypothetical protein IJR66_02625 [Clostridia bacterium]|nr:hypothetical protein [Clostridia bacterium]
MQTTSKMLSIIAYYLSEYDMKAVFALGYSNRSEAMKSISIVAGRDNNYLKLRRDEFDALPESSSSRNGWKNRPPSKEVVEMGAYLRTISFDDLTEIVKSLIANFDESSADTESVIHSVKTDEMSEEEMEQIINLSDPNATIEVVTGTTTRRVCNTSIIHKLKKLYKGQCQICGRKPIDGLDEDICEAHHIEHFSETQNNNANNIIIVCPNHHRLLHKLNPIFSREELCFKHRDKNILILLDLHLKF